MTILRHSATVAPRHDWLRASPWRRLAAVVFLFATSSASVCEPVEDQPIDDGNELNCGETREVLWPVEDAKDLFALAPLELGNLFVGSDGVATTTSAAENDLVCQGVRPDVDLKFNPETSYSSYGLGDLGECGPADGGGEVVCHASESPTGDGPQLVVALGLGGEVPLDQGTDTYQYGIVLETDGDSTNDWVPLPEYPQDFFAGTDLWFEINYAPGSGWALDVNEVGPENALTPRTTSGARALVREDVILFTAPMNEVGAGALGLRTSTFKHQGGYLNDSWNGDAHPFVDDGLRPVP